MEEEKKLYEIIGKRISKERKTSGYTQEELANFIGLTRASIVNIEKGRQRLPLHILTSIALKLNMETKDFIPLHEEINNNSTSHIEHIQNQDDLSDKEKQSVESLIEKMKNS